jgi:transposase
MARHPDHGKERQWLDLIRGWQGSRLSVRAFCRRHRLSEPTFYAWRRVLRERGLIDDERSGAAVSAATTPAFVKVAVDASASAHAGIDVVLAEGRRLRVRPGFDADLLRQLLRVLEEPSC